MNHLDDGAEANRALTAIAGCTGSKQKQRRTQTLAAAFSQILGNFRDGFDRGAILRGNLLFDERHIVSDEIEDASCDGNGEGHSVGFTLPGRIHPRPA